MRLEDAAAAAARAEASDGVHFSFEKLDHVTCSTVCGRLLISEGVRHRNALVSFEVDSLALETASEEVSTMQAERRAADEAREREQCTAAAAEDAARQASASKASAEASAGYEHLSRKREAGKERQAEIAEKAKQKKGKQPGD